MSEEQQAPSQQTDAPAAPEKSKNANVITSLNAFAYRLTAPNQKNVNDKDASLQIGFTGFEHPRLHVKTQVATDPREGYLGVKIDTHILRLMATFIRRAAKEGGKFEIPNKGHYDKDGNYTETPVPTSRIIVGRDKDNIVFVACVAEGYTVTPFKLQYNTEYHEVWINGVQATPAESSALFAENFADAIIDLLPIVHDQIARSKGTTTTPPNAKANEESGPADLPPEQNQYRNDNNNNGGNRNWNNGGNRNNGNWRGNGGGGGGGGNGNWRNNNGGNRNYNNGRNWNGNNGGNRGNYQNNNGNRNWNNNNGGNQPQQQQSNQQGFDPMADAGNASSPLADLEF